MSHTDTEPSPGISSYLSLSLSSIKYQGAIWRKRVSYCYWKLFLWNQLSTFRVWAAPPSFLTWLGAIVRRTLTFLGCWTPPMHGQSPPHITRFHRTVSSNYNPGARQSKVVLRIEVSWGSVVHVQTTRGSEVVALNSELASGNLFPVFLTKDEDLNEQGSISDLNVHNVSNW